VQELNVFYKDIFLNTDKKGKYYGEILKKSEIDKGDELL
jgi:hypothetical protein